MMDLRFRPFETAPKPPKGGRRKSTFSASWTKTLNDLEREMEHLKARDIVIEAETTRDQIRNDGWPYSNARMGPTVAISFASVHGPMRYECGTFNHWQDNLRSIGLTLAALRAVDRYGATTSAEQYRGFAALPPPSAAEFRSKDDAARFVWITAGWPSEELERLQFRRCIDDADVLRKVYRDAATKAHPDAGGAPGVMEKLNRAKAFIEGGVA